MGSLLPGWDASAKPTGFEPEPEEDEQPKGYFAKLEKSRSVRHPNEDPPFVAALPHAYSLRRHSMPHEVVAAAKEKSNAHSHQPLSEAAASLSRNSLRRPKAHTDWAEELRTLGGGAKQLDRNSTGRAPERKLQERWSFAQHMEHSVLNEPTPDVAGPYGPAPAPFAPQFGVAGNHSQYRSDVSGR